MDLLLDWFRALAGFDAFLYMFFYDRHLGLRGCLLLVRVARQWFGAMYVTALP